MPQQDERKIDLQELLHGQLPEVDAREDFVTAARIVDCRCLLGEGVLFDDRTSSVLWTDLLGLKLHRLILDYQNPSTLTYMTYPVPKKLCSFGLLQTTSNETELPLLCAWEDGFQLYDLAAGRPLSETSEGVVVNPNKGGTRLNDGRTDPQGRRFVCGGFFADNPEFTEKVFKVEQIGGKLFHHPIVDEIQGTNGICWSLDGKTMYLADSPTQKIHTYAYDADSGTLSQKKLFNEKHEKDMVPDGSCVDSEGYVWNAVWCHGDSPSTVQRLHPETGKCVYTVHMPDSTSQVSCCCFGGKDLDILFITSAAVGRDVAKQPHAGSLYAVRVPFKGRKESRLNFNY